MSQIKENAAGQSRFPLNEAEKEWLHKEEEEAGKNLEEYPKDKVYGMCFACGEDNPVGLHLHFFPVPDGQMAFFTPKPEHQSYNGRMHGGLITVLLDEVMGNYLFKKEGVPAYTARIDLRFREPIAIGSTIKCEAREIKRKGRLVIMEGKIINQGGAIAAEAVSHLMLEANKSVGKIRF